MLTLVYGGSASGKSAYAEKLAVSIGGARYYIATMQPFGETAQARIKKHREERSGKGFHTLECYTGLDSLILPEKGTVLLECLGNLTANELFSLESPGGDPVERICRGMLRLEEQCSSLVAVTNDVFREGVSGYGEETLRYIEVLGAVNCFLAEKAEQVIEVVCGIPLAVKGELV